MKIKMSLLYCLFSFFIFTSCNDNEKRESDLEEENLQDENVMENTEDENNVINSLEEDPELSAFSQNLERNELSNRWREEENPVTIFVPTNTAFEDLPQERRDQFSNPDNRNQNQATMYYLVVEGETSVDDLRMAIENANGEYTLNSMQGEPITATMEGDSIHLTDPAGNTATIVESDRQAGNAIIHVINRVLAPSDPTRNEAVTDTTQTGGTNNPENNL